MINDVFNILSIEKPKGIMKFLDGRLDLEKIIPCPQNISNKKSWQVQNWGCIGNAIVVDMYMNKYGLNIEFYTTFDTPVSAILKLSDMFPDNCMCLYTEYTDESPCADTPRKFYIRGGKVARYAKMDWVDCDTTPYNKKVDTPMYS